MGEREEKWKEREVGGKKNGRGMKREGEGDGEGVGEVEGEGGLESRE